MNKTNFSQAMLSLKEKGIRLTPQRQVILQLLKSTDSHLTADQVHRTIVQEFPAISLATVYNTLNLLVQNGVIRELTYGDDSSKYDGNDSDHAHLICTQCGCLKDIDLPAQEKLFTPEIANLAFSVSSIRLDFNGVCHECTTSGSGVA